MNAPDCDVCSSPVLPDADGLTWLEGTQDVWGGWLYGPMPVHEEPCRLYFRSPFDGEANTVAAWHRVTWRNP